MLDISAAMRRSADQSVSLEWFLLPSADNSSLSTSLERHYVLISSFCTFGILSLVGGVALSSYSQLNSIFNLGLFLSGT